MFEKVIENVVFYKPIVNELVASVRGYYSCNLIEIISLLISYLKKQKENGYKLEISFATSIKVNDSIRYATFMHTITIKSKSAEEIHDLQYFDFVMNPLRITVDGNKLYCYTDENNEDEYTNSSLASVELIDYSEYFDGLFAILRNSFKEFWNIPFDFCKCSLCMVSTIHNQNECTLCQLRVASGKNKVINKLEREKL